MSNDFVDVSNKYQSIVRDFIDNSEYSQRGLAREADVSSEIINRIVRGQNPNVQLNTLLKILEPTDYTVRVELE